MLSIFKSEIDKINVGCEVNLTGAENTIHSHTTQIVRFTTGI